MAGHRLTSFAAVHIVVILLVGSLLGVGFNAVRQEGRINLKRNYFRVADAAPPAAGQAVVKLPSDVTPAHTLPPHPYTVVTVDEVAEMVGSDAAYAGQIVFVDARRKDDFEEGRIAGAYNVDNYNVDRDLPAVRPFLDMAEKVVVYCGGGDCEDSIFLATELEFRGIARDRLLLFEGGMAAWTRAGLPSETGAGPESLETSAWTSAEPTDDGVSTP